MSRLPVGGLGRRQERKKRVTPADVVQSTTGRVHRYNYSYFSVDAFGCPVVDSASVDDDFTNVQLQSRLASIQASMPPGLPASKHPTAEVFVIFLVCYDFP